MFAATQDVLTQAFNFVAVASMVWLVTEYLYFSVSYPDPAPEAPQDTPQGDDTPPIDTDTPPAVPAPPTPPAAAIDLTKMKTAELRKLATARGFRGAGRWKKADLVAALT